MWQLRRGGSVPAGVYLRLHKGLCQPEAGSPPLPLRSPRGVTAVCTTAEADCSAAKRGSVLCRSSALVGIRRGPARVRGVYRLIWTQSLPSTPKCMQRFRDEFSVSSSPHHTSPCSCQSVAEGPHRSS